MREREIFIGADPNVDHTRSTINSEALKQEEESERVFKMERGMELSGEREVFYFKVAPGGLL